MRNGSLTPKNHPPFSDAQNHDKSNFRSEYNQLNISSGNLKYNHNSQHQFCLIVIDTDLPDSMYHEFFSLIKTKIPNQKIIVVIPGSDSGSNGSLLPLNFSRLMIKSADVNELAEMLKLILNGKSGSVHANEEGKTSAFCAKPVPALTKRELQILYLISEGLTNQEITCRLYISCSTVDSHRKNLLLKFNVHNTARLIKMAVSNGIIG